MLEPTTAVLPLRQATVPFVHALRDHGDRPALLAGEATLTYADLADRVEDAAARLGPGRRLVLLTGASDVETVVHHLAALHAGHVVLLAPPGTAVAALVERYDPDVVVRGVAGECDVEHRRDGSAHDLHPDLALLLTTSGSTGSPKLVRLSHENVQANAAAIAQSLGIRPDDRAVTTLPLHYSYGLSVLHSHLLTGAALVLTGLSVVDRCFWDAVREHRVTSFAGVPYTFELLDRAGFAGMDLPHLRYVTQAGGRLAPARVRHWAEVGRRRGWDLVVMYGQTEATARMTYLPPHLVLDHPASVGVPVPGGEVRLEPVPEADDDGVGELVYTGPNVMLGYAQTTSDLALGRTVTELRTGDLARVDAAGLVTICGRRSRFLKLFGLRVDLARLEDVLVGGGLVTACTGDDERLVVAVEDAGAPAVRAVVASLTGLPEWCVDVVPVPHLPRLPNGKPDLAAVRALAADAPHAPTAGAAAVGHADVPAGVGGAGPTAARLRDLYAELLNRPDATVDSTFVELGGDSLSYVEMSVRLEEALGHLPPDWHTTPLRDLAGSTRPQRRRTASVEVSVALRAVGILLVVGTHANLLAVPGGAHLLMAVAGYNLARFQVSVGDRWRRARAVAGSVLRVAVPSAAWIAGAAALTDHYGVANVLLLNHLLGPDRWGTTWHFWFLEAVLALVVVVTALLTVPAVDRLERRAPFGFALGLLGAGLVFRYGLVELDTGPRIQTPHMLLWLLALGWAAARARTTVQRLTVTAAALLTVPGFFENPAREALVAGAVCLLVWVTSVPGPRVVARIAGLLATTSLYVYVTHWMVYPHLEDDYPALAVLASFAVGVAYWWVWTRACSLVTRRRGSRRPPSGDVRADVGAGVRTV